MIIKNYNHIIEIKKRIKENSQQVTMYKNNSRFSSLKVESPEVGYYSYTNRYE